MSASDPSEDKNQVSPNGRERNSHVARRCRAKTNLWKNHLELFFFLIRILEGLITGKGTGTDDDITRKAEGTTDSRTLCPESGDRDWGTGNGVKESKERIQGSGFTKIRAEHLRPLRRLVIQNRREKLSTNRFSRFSPSLCQDQDR